MQHTLPIRLHSYSSIGNSFVFYVPWFYLDFIDMDYSEQWFVDCRRMSDSILLIMTIPMCTHGDQCLINDIPTEFINGVRDKVLMNYINTHTYMCVCMCVCVCAYVCV